MYMYLRSHSKVGSLLQLEMEFNISSKEFSLETQSADFILSFDILFLMSLAVVATAQTGINMILKFQCTYNEINCQKN